MKSLPDANMQCHSVAARRHVQERYARETGAYEQQQQGNVDDDDEDVAEPPPQPSEADLAAEIRLFVLGNDTSGDTFNTKDMQHRLGGCQVPHLRCAITPAMTS